MRCISIALSAILIFQPASAWTQDHPQSLKDTETSNQTSQVLTDAAIIALIIAGSVALYKATGHPCACPSDLMRNGHACGGRSAWSKPGGAKPLCFTTDVSSEMIKAYRATKAIPSVW